MKALDNATIDAVIRRIHEKMYETDPDTGLTIYNPGGHMTIDVDKLPALPRKDDDETQASDR